MLSESTARLVDEEVVLDEPELVRIKGSDLPVSARRLLGVAEHRAIGRRDSTLVGRQWELAALTGVLDRSIAGSGAVVGVAAPPGVGKSRLVSELAAIAASRGVSVYSTFCESHASEIPFHAVSRLLRGGRRSGHVRLTEKLRICSSWTTCSVSATLRCRRRTLRRKPAGAGSPLWSTGRRWPVQRRPSTPSRTCIG